MSNDCSKFVSLSVSQEVEPRLEERACSIFEKDAVDGAVVRQTMKASYDTINSNREWEAKVGKHEPSKSQVVPAVDGAAYQGTSVAFKVEDEPINSDKSGVEPNSNRPVRKARLKRRFDPSFIEDIKDEDDLEHDQPYKYDNKMTEQNIETTKAVGNDQRKKVMQPILQIVVPCPIDLVCPRKMRTYVEVRPRTSRASIAKLKQAAAGCLPLPPTVLGLLEDEEKQDDEWYGLSLVICRRVFCCI